ncbi:MAG: methyl-accepting chemotaxis protein [Proteobacteria bacterium]|nr:methyl-accepting chemotaxis protein [Pseudomonadota bacterium]
MLVFVLMQLWLMQHLERQTLAAAADRARMVADGAINGLNTLMITKAGDSEVISDQKSRTLYIEKIGKSEFIRELRVFRAKQLDEEFPPALPQELPADELDQRILQSGKEEIRLFHPPSGGTQLRVVVPYVAMKNFRSIECLKCHGVEEGFVLGGASVTIDIESDMAALRTLNRGLWIGQALLQFVLFLLIGLIVSRLLRQLGGEPRYVIDVVRHIAQGKLSEEIVTRPGDDSSLLFATRQMQAGLREIVGRIVRSAAELATSAQRLSASSSAMLQATERQNDASAASAASVEQLTACIGNIADNASEVDRHASETGSLARSGTQAVQEMVGEMQKISGAVVRSSERVTSLGESSNQISRIVSVIKEIADQTNLLALNAAIEAARAGEHGRGFAVVADEVRKLSERTALSTQEIAGMIERIWSDTQAAVEGMNGGLACVEEGVQMAGQADTAMGQIQGSIEQVLASVAEISTALHEQSATSNLIAGNVQRTVEMSEETSGIVRDVSAAAEDLASLAQQLKASVEQFSV